MAIHPLFGAMQLPKQQTLLDVIQGQQAKQQALAGQKTQQALREAQLERYPEAEKMKDLLTQSQVGKEQATTSRLLAQRDREIAESRLVPFKAQLLQAKAKASLAPNLTEQQKVFEREKAKVFGKRLQATYESADTAQSAIDTIGRFRNAMKKIPAALTTPYMGAFARFVPGYGHDVAEAESAHSALTVDFIKSIKTGQLTEKEREFFERAIPNVGQYKGVALQLADFLEAKYKRDLEKKKFVNEMLKQKKDMSEIESSWEDYINQNPLVGSDDQLQEKNVTGWRDFVGRKPEPTISTKKSDISNVEGTGFSLSQFKQRAKETGKSVRSLIDLVKSRQQGL